MYPSRVDHLAEVTAAQLRDPPLQLPRSMLGQELQGGLLSLVFQPQGTNLLLDEGSLGAQELITTKWYEDLLIPGTVLIT